MSERLLFGVRLGITTIIRARGGRADIVDVHTASDRDFMKHAAVVLAARVSGSRSILRIHGGNFVRYFQSYGSIMRWFVRWILRFSDSVVVLSEGWRAQISAIEPRARLVVIPNFVPVSEYESLSGDRSEMAEDILMLANLCEEKGHFDALDACVDVFKSHERVSLVLAGGEREKGARERLEKRARELEIGDRVEFLGPVDGESKVRAFCRSGIFILPSHAENMPMSIIEAMASALPVIATRVGAIPEMIAEGETGFIVGARDPQALRDRILELLGDRRLRLAMGARGLSEARRRWDGQAIAGLNKNLYSSLANGDDRPVRWA